MKVKIMVKPTPRLNREWHLANKMPTKPTRKQRMDWHRAHMANCTCRAPPPDILAEIETMRGKAGKKGAAGVAKPLSKPLAKTGEGPEIEAVRRFWALFDKGKFRDAGRMMLPDARVTWPNTDEEFDRDGFIAVNAAYPGKYRIVVERVHEVKTSIGEAMVATVVKVSTIDGSASVHATSFFTFAGNKIATIEEYWSDDISPPDWRRKMGLNLKK